MRIVVDSNCLASVALRGFLEESPKRSAVLTDYAAIEAYKSDDPINSILQQMEVLRRFPKQVVVLKPTSKIVGLRGRRAGLLRRMIDDEQTREFSEFGAQLVAAEAGKPQVQHVIRRYGEAAQAHVSKVTDEMDGMSEAITAFKDVFTEAERKTLRRGGAFSEAMKKKVVHLVFGMAAQLHKTRPGSNGVPTLKEMPYTLIFRIALCEMVLIMRWLEGGGAFGVKPEKHRNDLFDVNFAAFGTLFDGLMTDDKKAATIYEEAVVILREVLGVEVSGILLGSQPGFSG